MTAPSSASRINILLVDDQPANLLALEAVLEPLGECLVRATSGREALRLVLDRPFALLLLDVQMPEMDGYELAALIRSRETSRQTPIIFLTAGTQQEVHAFEGYSLGAVDFLRKPLNPSVLRAKVSAFVAMARWTQQLEDEVAFSHRVQQALHRANEAVETQLVERTQALQETEEQFRLLVEGVKDYGLLMLDPSGRIVTWNAGGEALYGYGPEEIVGRHFSCLFPGAVVAAGHPDFELEAAERRGRYEEEGWRVRKDGSLFRVHATVSPLRTPEGELRGFAKVVRDITERRAAEQADRERQAFVNALLDSLVDGVMACDAEGTLKLFNRAARNLCGVDVGQLPAEEWPKRYRLTVPGQATPIPLEGMPLYRALQGETLRDVEVVFEPAGCEPRHLVNNAQPIQDDAGNRLGAVVTIHDITERKQAEAALRASEAQLLQSQKMEAIGRLAGGIAHDFNNVLGVILGYSELALLQENLDAQMSADLREVHQAAKRAAGLTRQLLAFSRKQLLEPKLVDANELVAELERMLVRMIGEDVRLEVQLHPEPCPVLIDPGQMEQVLMNLAVNARDAMPRGGQLTVSTRVVQLPGDDPSQHPELSAGAFVELAVSDTGCGMDPEIQARIFEPFFTTKEPGQGTGLGLATAYGIVKQSGGDIRVSSAPGLGTTFRIHLPYSGARTGETPARGAAAGEHRGSETILLVEDETIVRRVVRMTLQKAGYTVLEADGVRDALSISERHEGRIDLLLTDLVMPLMSGRELAECLEVARPEMKVLFMSGYSDDAVIRHGIQTSQVDFIQKPFTPSALTQTIRGVLDGTGRADR